MRRGRGLSLNSDGLRAYFTTQTGDMVYSLVLFLTKQAVAAQAVGRCKSEVALVHTPLTFQGMLRLLHTSQSGPPANVLPGLFC
jgi:hypothetical protein